MSRLVFFFQSASASGVCLLLAALLGVFLANSPVAAQYFSLLDMKIGPLSILLWINDALMAIFFLFVGLEVKREMISGELNTNAKRLLPGIAAFFGLSVPAVIYYLIAGHTESFIPGWAIPTATDIAFAIGIVAILGSRVPPAMKVFLTALAVMDDLMAIIIIAVFYTTSIKFLFLIIAAMIVLLLIYCNKKNYVRPIPYIVLGIALWYCILQSGLHATLAGVILALTIPLHGVREGRHISPLTEWEHALSHWVSFFITPLFGFANAGVSFYAFSIADLAHPVVLGVALGLVLGKQLGIFTTLFFLVKSKIIDMPKDTSWPQVYGISLVCGIGFTMSLFVSLLAFEPGDIQEKSKIGIFIGSIISGVLGYIVLRISGNKSSLEK